MGSTMVAPGDSVNFQFWHRDAGAMGATSNFSEGLEIQFDVAVPLPPMVSIPSITGMTISRIIRSGRSGPPIAAIPEFGYAPAERFGNPANKRPELLLIIHCDS